MTPIEAIDEYLETLIMGPHDPNSKVQQVSLDVINNIKTHDWEPSKMMDTLLENANECIVQGATPSQYMFALLVCGITIGLQCSPSFQTDQVKNSASNDTIDA